MNKPESVHFLKGVAWGVAAVLMAFVLWLATTPVRAATPAKTIWVLVAIAFDADGDPSGSRIFGPMSSAAECNEAKAKGDEWAKANSVDVASKCVDFKRALKLPKPKPSDGDGLSFDGQRRGGSM